ncbi:MAG: hypothetical protein A2V67_19960 [Deltaproteobacteria bacterium RBG_13_61_14]|nr:MAG: hypothetical protein A2V67_19960 [Deltaproteobacteria bacterium RBG_13_61_14]
MSETIALKDRGFPRILSWKWGPDALSGSGHREKMEDILRRSGFDLIQIDPAGTGKTLFDDELRRRLAEVIELAHHRSRGVMLNLDPRPAAADFFQENPREMLGLIEIRRFPLGADGRASWESTPFELGEPGGLSFPFDHHETRVYAFDTDAAGRPVAGTLCDLTAEFATLSPEREPRIRVDVRVPSDHARRSLVVAAASLFRCPDLFGASFRDFFSKLLDACRSLKLDGISLEEWGFPAHPRPEQADRLHWYSQHLTQAYQERTGRDLVHDLIFQPAPPAGSESLEVEVPNRYLELIRQVHAGLEEWFYDKGKELWGPRTFIGGHPTGSAVTARHHVMEVWRNGLDWWQAKRDFAQSSEQTLLALRTALAHKWGGTVFYHLWSSLGERRIESYFRETWQNARYGGRLVALGYECPDPQGVVLELRCEGGLEQVSAVLERIQFLNYFQRAQPDCPVLVLMGYPAVSHPLTAVMRDGVRDLYCGPMAESYRLAQELWEAGILCDLVPSYEVEGGSLGLDREGRPRYGVQTYRAVIVAFPEFSRETTWHFLENCLERGVKLMVVGRATRDFYGREVKERFGKIIDRADFFSPDDPGPEDVIEMLKSFGIQPNPVRNGCRLLDGSVLVANPGEEGPGSPLGVDLMADGHRVEARCEDLFGIKLSGAGEVERLCGCMLAEVKVDGKEVLKWEKPRHLVVERLADGRYEWVSRRVGEEEKTGTAESLSEIVRD